MRRKPYSLFGYPLTHPLNIILIFNCFVFLLQSFNPTAIEFQFGLNPEKVLEGKIWQLFTYGFLHSTIGLPFHILFNMYAFYMLGSIIEASLGKWKLVLLYFMAQLGGGILVFTFSMINGIFFDNSIYFLDHANNGTIGASGAVFGLLAIFGVLFPEMDIFLLFFRVQARNAVWISLVVGYGLSLLMDTHISNTCNLGGALSGYLFHFLFLKNSQNRKIFSPNFSKEARVKSQAFKNSAIGKDEDIFEDQIRKNESLLKSLEINNFKDKEAILIPIQVPSANICPSVAFNPEDSICRRCEWLPNCALRKLKESN